MIQASNKPSQTIMIGQVTISLDRDYKMEVRKTVGEKDENKASYEVKLLECEGMETAVVDHIERTATAHLAKTGIW